MDLVTLGESVDVGKKGAEGPSQRQYGSRASELAKEAEKEQHVTLGVNQGRVRLEEQCRKETGSTASNAMEEVGQGGNS